jgi:hypothetical protein
LTLAASAGIWPLLFGFFLTVLGFGAGWYISHEKDHTATPQETILTHNYNIGADPSITSLLKLVAEGMKKTDEGPPST